MGGLPVRLWGPVWSLLPSGPPFALLSREQGTLRDFLSYSPHGAGDPQEDSQDHRARVSVSDRSQRPLYLCLFSLKELRVLS